jgi:hypothetical protein
MFASFQEAWGYPQI